MSISVGIRPSLLGNAGTLGGDSLSPHIVRVSYSAAEAGGCASLDVELSITDYVADNAQRIIGGEISLYIDGEEIWTGLVNEIDVQRRGISLTWGPLMQMATRIKGEYNTPSYNTTPPIPGVATDTGWVSPTIPTPFDLLDEIVSLGEMTTTDADNRAQTLVNQKSQIPYAFAVSRSNQNGAFLRCVGWFNWLDKQYYSYTAGDASIAASAKLRAAMPFVIDTSGIRETGATVTEYQEEETVKQIAENIAALSDSNNTRYVFGIGPGRRAYYRASGIGRYAETFGGNFFRSGRMLAGHEVKEGTWVVLSDAFANAWRSGTLAIPIAEVSNSYPDGSMTVSMSEFVNLTRIVVNTGG